MAGKPHLSRAKRYKFFHTSHVSTFEGSETQHVKTNLTASIDGKHKIKADVHHVVPRASFDSGITLNGSLDMSHNKIKNVENVLRSVKTTVPYTVFTATSRKFPQNVPLFRASPGDTVFDVIANHTVEFAIASLMGTGEKAISRFHVSVGDLGASGGFKTTIVPATLYAATPGWRWMMNSAGIGASRGTYLESIYATPLRKHYTLGTLVYANFRASEDYLASLDAGSMDFYVDVMSRS